MTAQQPLSAKGQTGSNGRPSGLARFAIPALSDWVFVSILFWLFFGHAGARTLLGDGDTGWHIRTGQYVLETGTFPRYDLFSFTMEGKEWYAWEWFADVLLALAYGTGELKGVVLLAGVVIAATSAALLRYMFWLQVNVLIAVMVLLMATSASMIHWLARPHMFTWLFLLATVWLLEADRRRPSWRVYLLVPLAVLWTNTHGAFVALPVSVAVYAVGVGLEQLWAKRDEKGRWVWEVPAAVKRYGFLCLLCGAATFVNPYTYNLHLHIVDYLDSEFILNHVQEFQSPSFRGESMKVYEVLLLASLIFIIRQVRRRELAPAMLMLVWAHASLVSARHVPLFVIVAAPIVARELTLLLEEGVRSGNTWIKAVYSMAEDYGANKTSPVRGAALGWLPLVGIAVIAAMLHFRGDEERWNAKFPEVRFPVAACEALGDRLTEQRVLSSDQWGDYLIYRFYPETKVFFDGRSDFYETSLRQEYLQLLGSTWRWEEIVERHEFSAALLPLDWALTAAMKGHPDWRVVYDDGMAVYFERLR